MSGRNGPRCWRGSICRTAGDLVFLFPRDYQDLSDRREIADLEEGQMQTVRGEVVEVDARSSGFGKSRVGVLVRAGQRILAGDVVQSAVHARQVSRRGSTCCCRPQPRLRGGRWEMAAPAGHVARRRRRSAGDAAAAALPAHRRAYAVSDAADGGGRGRAVRRRAGGSFSGTAARRNTT